jgi:hypothetical protein
VYRRLAEVISFAQEKTSAGPENPRLWTSSKRKITTQRRSFKVLSHRVNPGFLVRLGAYRS